MTVKMPVLGQPTRRRSNRGWVVLLLLAVAAGGFLYRRRKAPPPPPPLPVVALAPVAPAAPAPGSSTAETLPAPPGAAPQLAVGPRFISVRIDGPLETALVGGAGGETGPALAQVVKRVLVWWMSVPGDLRRGD